MRLIIASSNNSKVREIYALLGEIYTSVESMREAGFDGEIDETGKTFAENARIKAEAIFARFPSCAVLADDSGLAVDALGGAPGVCSARYAGEDATDADRRAKLLREMASVPDDKRSASFECHIILLRPDKTPIACAGRAEGIILREEKGSDGFGYDSLFYSPELGKTFAEASAAEKNTVSHRGRALTVLSALLRAEKSADKVQGASAASRS